MEKELKNKSVAYKKGYRAVRGGSSPWAVCPQSYYEPTNRQKLLEFQEGVNDARYKRSLERSNVSE